MLTMDNGKIIQLRHQDGTEYVNVEDLKQFLADIKENCDFKSAEDIINYLIIDMNTKGY